MTKRNDNVFANCYHVGRLKGLERYIKTNQYLPAMPFDKKVETNDIELSEMNKKLLKKN